MHSVCLSAPWPACCGVLSAVCFVLCSVLCIVLCALMWCAVCFVVVLCCAVGVVCRRLALLGITHDIHEDVMEDPKVTAMAASAERFDPRTEEVHACGVCGVVSNIKHMCVLGRRGGGGMGGGEWGLLLTTYRPSGVSNLLKYSFALSSSCVLHYCSVHTLYCVSCFCCPTRCSRSCRSSLLAP